MAYYLAQAYLSILGQLTLPFSLCCVCARVDAVYLSFVLLCSLYYITCCSSSSSSVETVENTNL
nr:MAG TPA: hypothetical protein [Microviridae sp.]